MDLAFSKGRAITAFSPFMTIGLSIRIGFAIIASMTSVSDKVLFLKFSSQTGSFF